eukprot:1145653-Pelagomonas_calceolata.AAC.5
MEIDGMGSSTSTITLNLHGIPGTKKPDLVASNKLNSMLPEPILAPAAPNLPCHARHGMLLFWGLLGTALSAMQCCQRHAQLCPAALKVCPVSNAATIHRGMLEVAKSGGSYT